MKVKVHELIGIFHAMADLSKRNLPVKLSYKIAKHMATLHEEIKIIGAEQQKIDGGDADDKAARHQELLSQDVTLKITKLSMADLMAVDDLNVPPALLSALMPILKEK